MKKYIFFVTNQDHWLIAAKKLYEKKIAEPVLWLGDDKHFPEANKLFGDSVFKDLIHRHRNYLISDIKYNGEYKEFFNSENYLRAKDRSIKMMDRLDIYGQFNRIDREVYFHNLLITYLKKIHDSKPDVLITAENPHDYPKYIIYEICEYLEIPCYKFFNWMLSPLLFLQNIQTGEIVKKLHSIPNQINKSFKNDLDQFIVKLKNDERYELYYMRNQRISSKILPSIKNFFKKEIIEIIKDFKHNFKMLIKGIYNPINPFRLNLFTRLFIKKLRSNNLINSFKNNTEEVNIEKDFVYFPLHYEPEKTTNPDGGFFHDQFLAIVELRKLVPDNIQIIVKEHPSQFYTKMNGSKGRSPLFYKLIKNVKNIKFIDNKFNSLDLIKKSSLVITITGSVALEASILGKKSLAFGNPWYTGCPNIFSWNKNLSFNQIIDSPISNNTDVINFLNELKINFSFPGFINGSQRRHFERYVNPHFEKTQNESIYNILEKLFLIDLQKSE